MRALVGAESACDEENTLSDSAIINAGVAPSNKFHLDDFLPAHVQISLLNSTSSPQVLKAVVALGVPTSEEDIKPVEVLISEVRN